MSRQEQKRHALVDERDALAVYFEALLQPNPARGGATPVLPMEGQRRIEKANLAAPAMPLRTPVARWGRAPFQAMLFSVAGLTLGVPLVELSGVGIWDRERLTPLPGYAPWYLGLVSYRDRSVPVVDTAALVLPPERLASLETELEKRLTRIIFIDEGEWGLACDAVAEVVTLVPEQVRWRTSRTRRYWLAGTIIEQMCALIDPPAFARMLATGEEALHDRRQTDATEHQREEESDESEV